LTISKDGQVLFGPTPVSHSTEGSLQNLKYTFEEEGIYNLEFGIEGILFQPIPLERVSYNVVVGDFDLPESVSTSQEVIEDIPIIPKTVPETPELGIEETPELVEETPELEEETEEKVVEEISGIFEEFAKIGSSGEQITIKVNDDFIEDLTPVLPYLGIIIAGVIGAIIIIKKRNSRKDELFADDGYDDDNENWLEENLTTGGTTLAQKYQDRQTKSPSNNANDIDPEKIVESKLSIIAKLQKYKMGDNDKLEAIKKSLIDDGSFTQEGNDYLEEQYAEYKKMTKKDSEE